MASGQALEAGQSYELSEADGDLLIRMGKAVEGEAPKPKAKRKPKANAAS